MEKFKNLDKYSEKLCDYYVEGFELFCTYMAQHHSSLDLSTLDMETIGNEILANHPSKVTAENEGVIEEVPPKNLVDPSPSTLP